MFNIVSVVNEAFQYLREPWNARIAIGVGAVIYGLAAASCKKAESALEKAPDVQQLDARVARSLMATFTRKSNFAGFWFWINTAVSGMLTLLSALWLKSPPTASSTLYLTLWLVVIFGTVNAAYDEIFFRRVRDHLSTLRVDIARTIERQAERLAVKDTLKMLSESNSAEQSALR